MTPLGSLTLVAGLAFVLILPYPILIWQRCGKQTHRLLKNDPAFGFFAPLIFPLAMGTLAKILTVELPSAHLKAQVGLALSLIIISALALAVVYTDMKMSPVEPYLTRSDDALDFEAAVRREVHQLYRELHIETLTREARKAKSERIHELQESATIKYRQLAPGFDSFRDVSDRGSSLAYVQLWVNALVALGCSTFFSFLLLAGFRAISTGVVSRTANATTICFGLLLLWFPLRLYTEWYANFYTFRSLKEYWAYWFLAAMAVIALLLTVIILKPNTLTIALGVFGTALATAFGTIAKLKPELVGYAAVLFEEMPLIPYVLALATTSFLALVVIVVAVTAPF